MGIAVGKYMPVSYTHLDVYKRQLAFATYAQALVKGCIVGQHIGLILCNRGPFQHNVGVVVPGGAHTLSLIHI